MAWTNRFGGMIVIGGDIILFGVLIFRFGESFCKSA